MASMPARSTVTEITISGSGGNSVVMNGTATLVSGTTYRYPFSGNFVDGAVNANLVSGSFWDLAGNLNAIDAWSFTLDTPDTTAPTASMSNPIDGATLTPASLNTQGYLQFTYSDIGDGVDAASINGDEISIGGAGVGSAVLSGTATLVSGTTYRYGFTGAFVDGTVVVGLVAGSLQDLAATPNLNAQDAWSFTVTTPQVTQTQIIDNGDAGFSSTSGWSFYGGQGYQNDIHFKPAGVGSHVANWTFTNLAAGNLPSIGHLVTARQPCDRCSVPPSWMEPPKSSRRRSTKS